MKRKGRKNGWLTHINHIAPIMTGWLLLGIQFIFPIQLDFYLIGKVMKKCVFIHSMGKKKLILYKIFNYLALSYSNINTLHLIIIAFDR